MFLLSIFSVFCAGLIVLNILNNYVNRIYNVEIQETEKIEYAAVETNYVITPTTDINSVNVKEVILNF